MVAFMVYGLALAGLVSGYIVANTSAEHFALSLAANAQASQWMEQMRSAQWDTASYPVVDQLTSSNFSSLVVSLEVNGSSSNVIFATNFAQITTISTTPPLRRIHVDCVWLFQNHVYTNSIETCRAPNQ